MVSIMADDNRRTHEREEKRETRDRLHMAFATAPGTRRRLPALRKLLLHAAVREILARSS